MALFGVEQLPPCISRLLIKNEKLAEIKTALKRCNINHPVFYKDEVDIHLNPKIGADWMHKGHQKRVATPGQNNKRYLADSLHTGTRKVSYAASSSKDSILLLYMLKLLKRQYRRTQTITLIIDKSKKTQAWIKQNPKFILLFQPVYSPWVNKIEQLWQALHETVTRNYQCKSIWKLMERVKYFMGHASQFPSGGHGLMKVEHN